MFADEVHERLLDTKSILSAAKKEIFEAQRFYLERLRKAKKCVVKGPQIIGLLHEVTKHLNVTDLGSLANLPFPHYWIEFANTDVTENDESTSGGVNIGVLFYRDAPHDPTSWFALPFNRHPNGEISWCEIMLCSEQAFKNNVFVTYELAGFSNSRSSVEVQPVYCVPSYDTTQFVLNFPDVLPLVRENMNSQVNRDFFKMVIPMVFTTLAVLCGGLNSYTNIPKAKIADKKLPNGRVLFGFEHTELKLRRGVKRIAQELAVAVRQHRKRLHDVHGHWRVVNRGEAGEKRVWVKEHRRGDETLGRITHDYRL